MNRRSPYNTSMTCHVSTHLKCSLVPRVRVGRSFIFRQNENMIFAFETHTRRPNLRCVRWSPQQATDNVPRGSERQAGRGRETM